MRKYIDTWGDPELRYRVIAGRYMNPKVPDECPEEKIKRKMPDIFLKKNNNNVDSNEQVNTSLLENSCIDMIISLRILTRKEKS